MKIDIRNFYKNSVVSSSEVRVNDDIRETHTAEDNAAQVTGINNETGECSAAMATTQKRKVCNVKKRKWNDNYTVYRFYCTKEEALNPYPSARCLFCTAVFGNSNLTPGHLQRHLKTQHPSHQNKLMVFFESCLQNHLKQLSSFENNTAKERNKDLVLASLQMAHVVMKESVHILSCNL